MLCPRSGAQRPDPPAGDVAFRTLCFGSALKSHEFCVTGNKSVLVSPTFTGGFISQQSVRSILHFPWLHNEVIDLGIANRCTLAGTPARGEVSLVISCPGEDQARVGPAVRSTRRSGRASGPGEGLGFDLGRSFASVRQSLTCTHISPFLVWACLLPVWPLPHRDATLPKRQPGELASFQMRHRTRRPETSSFVSCLSDNPGPMLLFKVRFVDERRRETSVCAPTYLCTEWSLRVCPDPGPSPHPWCNGDDALTNRAPPGPSVLLSDNELLGSRAGWGGGRGAGNLLVKSTPWGGNRKGFANPPPRGGPQIHLRKDLRQGQAWDRHSLMSSPQLTARTALGAWRLSATWLLWNCLTVRGVTWTAGRMAHASRQGCWTAFTSKLTFGT